MIKSKYQTSSRFDFNRDEVLKRDGEKCVQCGMTRIEHYQRFGRDITVDHIDGKGRGLNKGQRNDSVNNLQTLCLICHGKKDRARRSDDFSNIPSGEKQWKSKLTKEKASKIRLLKKEGHTYDAISKMFGVSPITIFDVVKNKTWQEA